MRSRRLASLAALLLAPLPVSAERLPTTVLPDHYDLAFVVDLAHERFEGTETIRVQVAQPTARVVLNALDIAFREVTIGAGRAAQQATVALDDQNQTATLTVPKAIERGPTEIRVRYSGVLNDQLRGFYVSKGKHRKYAVTQFESTDARRAFPCFDEPSFKATFAVTLTIDRGDTAISNGNVVSDTPGPAITQHTMRFATSPRMSSYLVAMAVGDFRCADGAADGIPIRVCATPDKKDLTRIALDSAQQILHFYDSYYAITYPFTKLDVVAVPDFAAGAMENTAAIFYRETDLLADSRSASVETRKKIASVLAHEMAHQWFGDLVTMAWWDDIWLNEGFATWMANKPLAAAHADWNVDVDEAGENETALNLDSLKATRPVHADVETPAQIDEAFDAIAYQKGAAVLRMIERYVGAETFREGINAYLQAHAYGNATSEDFWKAIASTSGVAVDRILPTFVNQAGVPLVSVSLSCPRNETVVTLSQQRFSIDSSGAGAGRSLWQVPVCFDVASSKRVANQHPLCVVLDAERHDYAIHDAGCQLWAFANVNARGYYRTAYSSDVLRVLAPRVQTQFTAPERLSLVNDEWALVRAGRHTAADYLTLASGYGREHISGVLDAVVSRLAFVREYLTTTATRPQVETLTRTLLRPLFDELGLSVAASDNDDRRTLRATVVGALGTTGNDPALISQARAALDRSLAGGSALDPTLQAAIVDVSAMHGDAKLFNALSAAADRAPSPQERYRYLRALAAFQSPALIGRGLRRALTPRLRAQDTALYLAQSFRNPAARDRGWAFVTEHWAALAPKVTISGGDVTLVHALAVFCDARSRDAIRSFFAAHPLPGAARTLEQTLEQIDNCIALREKQTPVVAHWLSMHR